MSTQAVPAERAIRNSELAGNVSFISKWVSIQWLGW